MINGLRIRRRLVLSHGVSGSVIFWTFLSNFNGYPAQAARPGRPGQHGRPLVVVDPGHGGRDPGATGSAGTLEKDVTLASAIALKAMLENDGRYRVELTRTDDRYVARDDRVSIARELGASLFLSMHADKLSDPDVRGISVYTLARRASDAQTEALADRENGLLPGDEAKDMAPGISEILASLAARENRAASARIARQLVGDFRREMPVLPSPERHANFTVLHTADIPSVLIEMGFLSNPADEGALNDPHHRTLIARATTRAIDAWFASTRRMGQG